MRILADENIPLAEAFFSDLGVLVRKAGRTLCREDLQETDVLLVRSVTPVNAALLEGTPVRFVGTCTIGTDHLDLDYLHQAGIHWASAPGCNARGVVDYVLGSLLALAEYTGAELSSRCYGIVGVGQVGSRLAKVLKGLGWRVLLCDPPRQAQYDDGFVPLEQLRAECDVISLHTPLTYDGPYRTHHLFDGAQLAALRPGCWLINASRGAVVDNDALREALTASRPDLQVVLDVWEHEPRIDPILAQHCRIATPHIAGYSLEGKVRGTAHIYQALCHHLGVIPHRHLKDLLPPPQLQRLVFGAQATPEYVMTTACRAIYDPRSDDARFRQHLLTAPLSEQAMRFDALRKHYPIRREIEGLEILLTEAQPTLAQWVRALGATLCETSSPLGASS